jgi:hypothetical protein
MKKHINKAVDWIKSNLFPKYEVAPEPTPVKKKPSKKKSAPKKKSCGCKNK